MTPPPTSAFMSYKQDNTQSNMTVNNTPINNTPINNTPVNNTPVNTEDNKQVNHTPVNSKLKTKICTFYLKGKCTKGDNCTFIHNDQIAQSTQTLKDASKDVGKVIPPLCRYGQNCSHLANGECCFGHYKSLVMNFNLARKQNKLAPVKAGAIYPDIRHKESKKTHTNNTNQAITVK